MRDLWTKTDLGSFTGSYTRSVAHHDCEFLKIVESDKHAVPPF